MVYPLSSMTFARLLGLIFVLSILPTMTSAQSLAEVAKKERARRDKNQEKGVEAQEFTETEIFGEDEEEPGDGVDGASDPDEGDAGRTDEPAFEIDLSVGESPGSESGAEASGGDEAQWRDRSRQARTRVNEAHARKQRVDTLHYVPGMVFVDERGNVVIRSLAELRELVSAVDQEVTDAESALEALNEQARRAGVPPGWLR